MKTKLTIFFLAIASIGFAQKRELKKIEKAIDKRDYTEAQEIYDQIDQSAVEDKYKDDVAFYNGVLLIGNPAKANASFEDLVMAVDKLDQAGQQGYDKSKVDTYKSFARNALVTIADDKLSNQDPEGALVAVEKVLSMEPENNSLKMYVAALSYQTEDYDKALSTYQELLDEGYTGSTIKYYALRSSDGKKEYFPNEKAAQLAILSPDYTTTGSESTDSKLGQMVGNTVWLYKNEGEIDKAKSVFKNMQAKYPSDTSLKLATPDIYLTLGMQDEYEEAITSVNEEITDPKVYQNLAEAAAQKGNLDQAIDYYSRSIALDPNNYVTQNNIATAYINKGNLETVTADEQTELYTKAIEHMEKVVELKPEESTPKQTLLSLYNALQMTEKAEALQAKM
jgi:tetratricopeptide (TPR) repeat protein